MHGLVLHAGPVVLDGGLATQLEAAGADLSGLLWSARLLHEDPAMIRAAHAAYIEAGADLCISASYQCHVGTLTRALNIDAAAAECLIVRSVELAREACDAARNPHGTRCSPPLVAASIGPFGACENDGSEYTGAYGVGPAAMRVEDLMAWHRRRFELLVSARPDVLAMETLPCVAEVEALCLLLRTAPSARAWVSLACGSGTALSSGEPLADAVRLIARLDTARQVQAIGVNCTAPRHVASLLDIVREHGAGRAVVCYPNSGERWDAPTCSWCDDPDDGSYVPLCLQWCDAHEAGRGGGGPLLIGGCCRVGPAQIRGLRDALYEAPVNWSRTRRDSRCQRDIDRG